MSETKQTHTPGAMRAILALTSQLRRGKSDEELADIISRETGDLGMLEALEAVLGYAPHERWPFTNKVEAAIRKAKGEL